MSRITLKPLDDGQKAVEIPVGKTTIGRGPFLGCSDKKVSRNHAVLEVTSKGEVYLTPTHVNPCFYQPTAESPGQILKKDIPHKLENGDSFSLLPRAFRYQLIVTGENPEDKTDQNDLNKQSGKTNGAAADCEEALLNERNKDTKAGKGISNEELNDGNTVTEKPFSKEDEILANIDKTYSKEENTFAKKIADITEDGKSQCSKEDKEINEDKEIEKDKLETSVGSKTEVLNEEKQAQPSDLGREEIDETSSKSDRLETKHEVGADEKTEEEKSKFGEKVVEENESTLGNDSFPKDKTENEHAQSNDKLDSKNLEDKVDKKSDDVNASNGDNDLDQETAKDFVEKDEKTRTLPDWIESDMPPPKGSKKRGPPKRQPAEKKPAKRKLIDEEAAPKSRGRKKTPKFTFDDEGEGSSRKSVPGRTSSRTNRQTRQGLSLEDFIVSDDDEWQSDRSSPKPRKRRGKRRGDDSGSDWEIEHKKTKKPTPHKFGSGSESGSDWGSQKKKKGPKGRRRKAKRAPSEVGSEEEVEQEPPTSESEKKQRMPCTYGKKCFRRNQNHLDQFSHPGDSDHDLSEAEVLDTGEKNEKSQKKNDAISESEEEEEDVSSKKECPFGANCFRKNPQHKLHFKHTKKVRPKREAAKQADKKARGSKNSDVDSYDLNDSLLNDESDEYKPADSGSDYESGEKMKRFLKGKAAKNKRGKKV